MPSVRRKCCIKNCPGLSRPKVLFRFPLKEPKRSEWLRNCVQSFQKILELRQPLICDIHFEKNQLGKKKLYCGAVPTLYLNNAGESNTKYIKEKTKIRCGEIYKIQDDDEDCNNYSYLCTICRNTFQDIETFTKHIDIFHNDIFKCTKDSSEEKNDETDKIVDEEIVEAESDSCTSESSDLNLNKGFLKFSEINTENEGVEMDLETANKCLNDSLLLNIKSEKDDQNDFDGLNKNKPNNCSNLTVQEIKIDKNQEHFNVCNQNLPNSSSSNENNSSSLILREIKVEPHEDFNYDDQNKSNDFNLNENYSSNLMVREIKVEKDQEDSEMIATNFNGGEEDYSSLVDENEYHGFLNSILPQIKFENEQENEMETSVDNVDEEIEISPNNDNDYNTNTIQVSDDQNETDKRSFLNSIMHLKDGKEITIIKICGKKKS